jgi:hypothetical protein
VTVARPAPGGFVEGKGASMIRKLLNAVVFAGFGLLAMLATYGTANSANARADVEISEVMRKSFGKDGLKGSVTAAVKGEKWDDATKLAKEWVELGAALGKNMPPKGDAASWEKQCAAFATNTKNILKACEEKNAKAALKAIGSFNCGGCHKAHKP